MKRKIAIYARVSTEHEAQISALENQIQYYDEILKKHPEWELYERYIDEGITGTSIGKRDSFLRMMSDAKDKCFDLIVTREVSRFARNIVDTLQQTRTLKQYGVEVYFTDDNIWTMNDEDGELRLSIMATLAQNESKKTSMRVKAGQMISFKNGVFYGNGNILGYDREGKNLVINPTQALTVKRIFELYLQGNGIRKIQFIMEQEKRKTSLGKTKWSASNIARILKNPFYCGRIEYRKQYVPDYLTQKKINNHGEIERVITKGTHDPIVSEEDFDKVQEIFKTKTTKKDNKKYGKPLADNVWVRKLKCKCGHGMNRKINYVSKITGVKTYSFQCHDQIHTGTIKTRLKKGLSIDGICDNKSFPEWKLEVQADFIFRKLLLNKQEIYETAIEMLESSIAVDTHLQDKKKKIEDSIKNIDKLKARNDILLDMCTDGDISRETFKKKVELNNQNIHELEEKIKLIRKQIEENDAQEDLNKRIVLLSEFIKMKAFSKKEKIPETIIEKYVEKIIFYKDDFEWYLRPAIGNVDFLSVDTKNMKKGTHELEKTMCYVPSSTGSDKHETLIKNPLFIGAFTIPRNLTKDTLEYYYKNSQFNIPDKMEIKVYLI